MASNFTRSKRAAGVSNRDKHGRGTHPNGRRALNASTAARLGLAFVPREDWDIEPTTAMPGTPEKVVVLRERVELGQPLWVAGDPTIFRVREMLAVFESLNGTDTKMWDDMQYGK